MEQKDEVSYEDFHRLISLIRQALEIIDIIGGKLKGELELPDPYAPRVMAAEFLNREINSTKLALKNLLLSIEYASSRLPLGI